MLINSIFYFVACFTSIFNVTVGALYRTYCIRLFSYGKVTVPAIVVVSFMCWYVLQCDWLHFWELPVVIWQKIASLYLKNK